MAEHDAAKAPRLGELLIEMGHLTEDQLEIGLTDQRQAENHEPLGIILVRSGVVTHGQVEVGLMRQDQMLRQRVLTSHQQNEMAGTSRRAPAGAEAQKDVNAA